MITDYGDYRSHGYLPLFLFEGLSGQFVTAALRPGQRLTGAENAMIVKRVMKRRRAAWPHTHLILRGDGHFVHPELMAWVSNSRSKFHNLLIMKKYYQNLMCFLQN